MTDSDQPSFKYPTIIKDRSVTIMLLDSQEVTHDNAEALEEFIRILDITVNRFRYDHHKINTPIIDRYNTNLRDIQRFSEGKIDQVTALTFHTAKGSVTFEQDGMTASMFRLFLAGPRPDNRKFRDQIKYLTAENIVFPLKEYSTPHKDQLFNECIKAAIPLGILLLKAGYKKPSIRKLIETTISHYFENLTMDRDPNANKQAFKMKFWPEVERVT